jgi:hypothetical protein
VSAAAPSPTIFASTHCAVLDREVVRLEVDVSEDGLERRAGRAGADERGGEVGRDGEHGRLRVVKARLFADVLIVPDVDKRRGRGLA